MFSTTALTFPFEEHLTEQRFVSGVATIRASRGTWSVELLEVHAPMQGGASTFLYATDPLRVDGDEFSQIASILRSRHGDDIEAWLADETRTARAAA